MFALRLITTQIMFYLQISNDFQVNFSFLKPSLFIDKTMNMTVHRFSLHWLALQINSSDTEKVTRCKVDRIQGCVFQKQINVNVGLNNKQGLNFAGIKNPNL